MGALVWLIPAFPLAGFLVLAPAGGRLGRRAVSLVGAGSVLASAVAAAALSASYLLSPPQAGSYAVRLWVWVSVGGFEPSVSLYFDRLSLLMVLVITWVGFWILLYSVGFMKDEEGHTRFFAVMDLFVASMLVLVLAGDLIPLYAGWEGVGLCSYLLIGFWHADPANGRAARKAFVVTRIGDAAMALGMVLLFTHLGTLDIQELMGRAAAQWGPGSNLAVWAAALLLAGAVGKSAQLPLQVWLPDAMAGPTPVSALIHAATMVTAGVYLIARTSVLFALAPPVQDLVALTGLATLLVAAASAAVQRDIKRVLAYSTISQIGYMFLAMGVGAYSAALFHFMTHAFFKALLFLSAGVVIQSLGHERDMFRMGGLRRELPAAFWTFLAGAASLAALPFLTAGYYSKDLILVEAFFSSRCGLWLWLGGLAGALLTALYAFRMVFLVFFGPAGSKAGKRPGIGMVAPLAVLAAGALLGGFVDVPGLLARQTGLFPASAAAGSEGFPGARALQGAASLAVLAGVFLAYLLYGRGRAAPPGRVSTLGVRQALRGWLARGWGFDGLYAALIAGPFVRLSRLNRDDVVDLIYDGVAWYSSALGRLLAGTQSGRIHAYVLGIVIGVILALGMAVLL